MHVNRWGGYQWFVAASTPCRQNTLISCLCVFIHVNRSITKKPTALISFMAGKIKSFVTNSVFDVLFGGFNICEEEKDSQVLLLFPLMRLEDYWLFTMGARLY